MHTCDLFLIEKWDENQSQKILNQYVSNIKNSNGIISRSVYS